MTFYSEQYGATKQLKDLIGLYLRENDQFFPPLPASADFGPGNNLPQSLEQVDRLAEQWLRHSCYCQIRSPFGLPGHGIFGKFGIIFT